MLVLVLKSVSAEKIVLYFKTLNNIYFNTLLLIKVMPVSSPMYPAQW